MRTSASSGGRGRTVIAAGRHHTSRCEAEGGGQTYIFGDFRARHFVKGASIRIGSTSFEWIRKDAPWDKDTRAEAAESGLSRRPPVDAVARAVVAGTIPYIVLHGAEGGGEISNLRRLQQSMLFGPRSTHSNSFEFVRIGSNGCPWDHETPALKPTKIGIVAPSSPNAVARLSLGRYHTPGYGAEEGGGEVSIFLGFRARSYRPKGIHSNRLDCVLLGRKYVR